MQGNGEPVELPHRLILTSTSTQRQRTTLILVASAIRKLAFDIPGEGVAAEPSLIVPRAHQRTSGTSAPDLRPGIL